MGLDDGISPVRSMSKVPVGGFENEVSWKLMICKLHSVYNDAFWKKAK